MAGGNERTEASTPAVVPPSPQQPALASSAPEGHAHDRARYAGPSCSIHPANGGSLPAIYLSLTNQTGASPNEV